MLTKTLDCKRCTPDAPERIVLRSNGEYLCQGCWQFLHDSVTAASLEVLTLVESEGRDIGNNDDAFSRLRYALSQLGKENA